MEQTVFLFCSAKQFTAWMSENCGNCRKGSDADRGCDLSAALRDAQFRGGSVPLDVAERLGYFDMDDEECGAVPDSWTCRAFHGKDFPPIRPRFADESGRPGELPGVSPRPSAR